jgi:hypothetical protein
MTASALTPPTPKTLGTQSQGLQHSSKLGSQVPRNDLHLFSSFGLGAATTKAAVNVDIVIRIAAAEMRIVTLKRGSKEFTPETF